MTLASIIIPTYNRPESLERALMSVLKQTMTDFEIIVVNDHNENMPVCEIINRLNDPRILYLENERTKGGNGARNTGILHATGQYIALLDDDDEWMPQKLEKQINKLVELDSSWGGCYCGYTILIDCKWINSKNLPEGNIYKEYLLSRISIGASSTILIRKSSFYDISLFDEDLERHQDFHFMVNFLRQYKLACTNDILIKINGHNIPAAEKIERAKLILFDKLAQDIDTLSTEESRYFFAQHYRSLASLFSLEGNIAKTFYYLNKSAKYRLLPPGTYITSILNSIDKNKGWNLNSYYDKAIKYFKTYVI